MNLLQEIITQNREAIEQICKKYGILLFGIFGSSVRGDYKDDSDIDVLLKFEKVRSLLEIIHIENELSDLFKKKTEVVEIDAIRESLKEYIMKDLVIIYEER